MQSYATICSHYLTWGHGRNLLRSLMNLMLECSHAVIFIISKLYCYMAMDIEYRVKYRLAFVYRKVYGEKGCMTA
jgi:hypothetical protein